MRFARAFGGDGDVAFSGDASTPGQFDGPAGVAVVRGLLVVADARGLQVLTQRGVPLQVLSLGGGLLGLCTNEQRLWVTGARTGEACRLHSFVT